MKRLHIIVVGAGINGVTSAIELKKRGHQVTLVDPGPLPHPLAASTDISKVVRAAYGPDEQYTALAERSIELWREWNRQFGADLYHETGVLFLRRNDMQPGDYEYESLELLRKHGRKVERIRAADLRQRFPAWNAERYGDGIFEREAGYAESGRAVAVLVQHARSLGVELREGASFARLDEGDNGIEGIVLNDGSRLSGDKFVAALGAWTPFALPFTRDFFRSTGQPVFHLRPAQPELFAPERFPVFGADISKTGYYGFPISKEGVVKIANHGVGREMSPDSTDRAVTPAETERLREFLRETFPALMDAPIVDTRLCMYCDTVDGDFWIAPDPQRAGLVIAAGDSGHGFKFAPVLGEIIADATEGKPNRFLEKFRWRAEARGGQSKEAARFRPEL